MNITTQLQQKLTERGINYSLSDDPTIIKSEFTKTQQEIKTIGKNSFAFRQQEQLENAAKEEYLGNMKKASLLKHLRTSEHKAQTFNMFATI